MDLRGEKCVGICYREGFQFRLGDRKQSHIPLEEEMYGIKKYRESTYVRD